MDKGRRRRFVLLGAVIAVVLLLLGLTWASTYDPTRNEFERIARKHGLEPTDPKELSRSAFDYAQVAYTSDGMDRDDIPKLLNDLNAFADTLPKGIRQSSQSSYMHTVTFTYLKTGRVETLAMEMNANINIAGGTHVVLVYAHRKKGLIERVADWWEGGRGTPHHMP